MNHLLEVRNLTTSFFLEEGELKAVNDISFTVPKGKTLGIVGESGCGKSVTALSIMRLIPEPPGKIVSGQILFQGKDLTKIPLSEMRDIRGNKISMIFQEPMTSLNPVFTIGNQIEEAIALHQNLSTKEVKNKTVEMLRIVGISSPEKRVHDYPHQLSGGMRQRVMIAMALSCEPDLLIADEPTTALDVTIQAQILDLLRKLQDEFGMSIMIITHDLGVVAEIAHEVIVMYAGKIVEKASVEEIFELPLHPYTIGLLKSIPSIQMAGQGTGEKLKRLETIPGMVPNILDLEKRKGCPFEDRCFLRVPHCKLEEPQLLEIKPGHWVSCFEAKVK